MSISHFDVVVVGGGHAGIEAAAVAARRGLQVALVSLDVNAVGRMSCNPAIGGIGKGQLVREIDALGGLMGLIADKAGIQFRLLNTSKGKAVQSPRAQCDRDVYEQVARKMLSEISGLHMLNGEIVDLLFGREGVKGVQLADGNKISCRAVILTTGTFLEGVLHEGLKSVEGGRVGEGASHPLGETLRKLNVPTARLKTGTPPRIDLSTVDFSQMTEQFGDERPTPFSFLNDTVLRAGSISCWLTKTTPKTQKIVLDNLHQTAMYSGKIDGAGPRYCPSLEDKVVRFSDRDSHTIFLEPEGVDSNILYANGISTSLPADVQLDFVRTCIGMEKAEILQPGYAVEYTHVAPVGLLPTLEYRGLKGLFFAGQICGTSGYEEAAAQGFMAGLNAALALQEESPFILGRHEAYIGVLVDDLVMSNPEEPYRMFTSRAEHRLLLRHDNADQRLTPLAEKLNIICSVRRERFAEKMDRLIKAKNALESLPFPLESSKSGSRNLLDVCKQPHFMGWKAIFELHPELKDFDMPLADWESIEADALYSGYASRQEAWVERGAERAKIALPLEFDYSSVVGLRAEAIQCLKENQPTSMGQAGRLAGVTPADLAILEIALVRWQRTRKDFANI